MLTIILSVVGGVFGLVILWAVIAHVIGKKKEHKLDENIKKLKDEKKTLDDSGVLTIASEKIPNGATIEEGVLEDENISKPEEIVDEKIVDEKQPDEIDKSVRTFDLPNSEKLDDLFKSFDNFGKNQEKTIKKRKKKDDFESFLDKHSYTRRIIDKNILKKIQELPPEIKAIVISNIFTRPQD